MLDSVTSAAHEELQATLEGMAEAHQYELENADCEPPYLDYEPQDE